MRAEYNEQLNDLAAILGEMAALAGSAMERATQSLLQADLSLAEQVITEYDRIAELSLLAEERAFALLALQAPVAGDLRYLALARRFSHQAILQPLADSQDKLTGLHANTQIPKVIGFKRIADMTGRQDLDRAAAFLFYFALAAGVPVVLVGDIDRGHVIAALVGAQAVLDAADAAGIRLPRSCRNGTCRE